LLGDKYDLPEFQDKVMLELLGWSTKNDIRAEQVKLVFGNTLDGSHLRMLIAGGVAASFRRNGKEYRDLDDFDGVSGFTSELVEALDALDHETRHSYRASPCMPCAMFRIGKKKYLIGDGGYQAWIHMRMKIPCKEGSRSPESQIGTEDDW
jgi:hypothetical protein